MLNVVCLPNVWNSMICLKFMIIVASSSILERVGWKNCAAMLEGRLTDPSHITTTIGMMEEVESASMETIF